MRLRTACIFGETSTLIEGIDIEALLLDQLHGMSKAFETMLKLGYASEDPSVLDPAHRLEGVSQAQVLFELERRCASLLRLL